jgi:hypothetical protein
MNAKQKNSLLAVGVLAGLASLPTTWVTIRDAQVKSGLGEIFDSAFSGMTITATCLTGSVTLLVSVPLWLVVSVSIVAGILQLMRYSQAFAIPKLAEWATAIVGVVWASVPMVIVLFSCKATPGIGWLFGVLCAAAPLVCLITPIREVTQTDGNAGD